MNDRHCPGVPAAGELTLPEPPRTEATDCGAGWRVLAGAGRLPKRPAPAWYRGTHVPLAAHAELTVDPRKPPVSAAADCASSASSAARRTAGACGAGVAHDGTNA